MRILSILAAGLLLTACSGADVAVAQPVEQQRTMSVTGEGTAFGAPDMAMLNFAVVTEGKTASEAMAANAARMTKVRDALRNLGVEQRDMQTAGFNLSPRYEQDERGRTNYEKIIGYSANNGLNVRLRDVAKVGEAIDKSVAAGANSLNGLSFGFQDQDDLIETARRDAVKDARALADLLAEEAGVKVGKVISINLQSYRPQPQAMRMEMAMADAKASTPIEAGESSLSVTVHILYEIE